jgi:hypothetical protein
MNLEQIEKRGAPDKEVARDENGRFTSGPGMAHASDVHHLGGGEGAIPHARAGDVREVKDNIPMAHDSDVHEVDDIPMANDADVKLVKPPRLPSQRHSQPARSGPPGVAARMKAQDKARRYKVDKADYAQAFRDHAKGMLDQQTYDSLHKKARGTAGGTAMKRDSRVVTEIRFDKGAHSQASAKTWLRQNNYNPAGLQDDGTDWLFAAHAGLPTRDDTVTQMGPGIIGKVGRYAPDEPGTKGNGLLDAVAKVWSKILQTHQDEEAQAPAAQDTLAQPVAKANIDPAYFDAQALLVGTDYYVGVGYEPSDAEGLALAMIQKTGPDSFADEAWEYTRGPVELQGLDLHLGSGGGREPGHIGLDLYQHDHGTVVHDLSLGIPFPDASARSVIVDKGLGDVSDDPMGLLTDIQRVLMPGGRLIYNGGEMIAKGYIEGGGNGLVAVGKSWRGLEYEKVASGDEPELPDGYDHEVAEILKSALVDMHRPGTSDSGPEFLAGISAARAEVIRKAVDPGDLKPMVATSAHKQVIYCVVLEPDTKDAHNDVMSPEDIEWTAHRYITKSRVVGSNHQKPIKAAPVESYVAPMDLRFEEGTFGPQVVKKGSWVIGIKIEDPDEWQKVLDGEYTGVSIGGFGLRKDVPSA